MKTIFKIRTFCDAITFIKPAGLRAEVEEGAWGQDGKTGNSSNKPTINFCPLQKQCCINRCTFHFLLNNTLEKKGEAFIF